jgi:hypothetical protein
MYYPSTRARWPIILVGTVLALAVFAVDAQAGGPASKEYQIPLDTARHNASGGGGSAPLNDDRTSNSASTPAFGVGVGGSSRPSGAASGGGGTGHKGGKGTKGTQAGGSGATGAATSKGATPAQAARNASTVDSSGSTIGLTIGLIAAVLLVGLGGGLLARRLGQR